MSPPIRPAPPRSISVAFNYDLRNPRTIAREIDWPDTYTAQSTGPAMQRYQEDMLQAIERSAFYGAHYPRHSGRTCRMLETLPFPQLCVVVAHNSPAAAYIWNEIRSMYDDDAVGKVRIITVSCIRDAHRLRGLSVPIYIDHAVYDNFEPQRYCAELKHIEQHSRTYVQYRAPANEL